MDFLVPSVLFGIALLAVSLLVILISTEARTKRPNATKPKATTTENHPEKPSEIETPETLPAAIVTRPSVSTGNQWSPLSHDQLQDLSLQLRNVHQKVHQIEQKLDILTTRIEHIEQMYNGHTQIEEEQETLELSQIPAGSLEDYPTQLS
jgi:hypothetical protein